VSRSGDTVRDGMSLPQRVPPEAFWEILRRVRWYVPVIVAGVVATQFGVSTFGFMILGLLIGITLMPMPSWAWAGAAVVVAIVMRGLTATGLLPTVLNFADFGLVYLGLAAVLIRRGTVGGRDARRLGTALLGLFAAILLSWAFNPTEIARPVLTFALWAEPFVLMLMLLAEPPDRRKQRLLLWLFAALVVLQIPFALDQWIRFGSGDPVVGTLTGADAGAHLVSGITVLGGLSLMTWAFSRSFAWGIAAAIVAAPLLIWIPIIADAKQILFALPLAAAVLFLTARGFVTRIALAVVPVVALLSLIWFVPQGETALMFLEDAQQGRSGKLVAFGIVREELGGSLTGWTLGLGPANGVSRAAYLTRPEKDSPLLLLDMEPASLPPIADAEAARVAGGTSFNLPQSSAVGVFSDSGLLGLAAFGAVIGAVGIALIRHRRRWLAQSALAGWAMSVPLAVTFDWWEEPPFMLTLAMLSALAIVWDPDQASEGSTDGGTRRRRAEQRG
jgi:hypothetical protein